MPRQRPVVALDGPAGAGKSTVARMVADALGFVLVDTGAIYRSVALAARRAGVDWGDADAVTAIARRLGEGQALRFEPPASGAETSRVLLDGEDVSTQIRTPEMSKGASKVSAIPGVRASLLELQRRQGDAGGVVLEGRDIGTVVFPDAEAKFFVTASDEVRARRRFDELRRRGDDASFEQTLAEVRARDEADERRAVAPLRPAEDAQIVDTSEMSVDEVVARIVAQVRALLQAR